MQQKIPPLKSCFFDRKFTINACHIKGCGRHSLTERRFPANHGVPDVVYSPKSSPVVMRVFTAVLAAEILYEGQATYTGTDHQQAS